MSWPRKKLLMIDRAFTLPLRPAATMAPPTLFFSLWFGYLNAYVRSMSVFAWPLTDQKYTGLPRIIPSAARIFS